MPPLLVYGASAVGQAWRGSAGTALVQWSSDKACSRLKRLKQNRESVGAWVRFYCFASAKFTMIIRVRPLPDADDFTHSDAFNDADNPANKMTKHHAHRRPEFELFHHVLQKFDVFSLMGIDQIVEQVAPTLRDKGLLFVGLDIIGDYLTEINVTSPTCIREIDNGYDLDIGGQLMDCIMEVSGKSH